MTSFQSLILKYGKITAEASAALRNNVCAFQAQVAIFESSGDTEPLHMATIREINKHGPENIYILFGRMR